jgi:ABC-2 type transport system permease protein
LIAVILLLICALLTSITIVREKEVGTMEQILVSPVHPIHVIIGKVVPYIVLGFVDATLVLIIGHLWFDVPILGSPITLAFTLLLYILTGLSLGLLISTITKSQQVAMLAALLATILPSIMLSGFIFPVTSMPLIFQWVSKVIPATHFLQIIRGIMLKGNGLSELMWQMVFLALLSTFFISISLKKFKTTLE